MDDSKWRIYDARIEIIEEKMMFLWKAQHVRKNFYTSLIVEFVFKKKFFDGSGVSSVGNGILIFFCGEKNKNWL